jgi:glycosyltransferase involved in cell wall biosynthesis
MAGFQQGAALGELMGAAAVFSLPSSHEGMPIAALEAMGLNRPLVISDIGPNLDLDLPQECYHIMGSAESLAAGLRNSIDAHAGDQLPHRDWSEWLAAFTWPTVARQTIAIYDRVAPRNTSQ